MNKVNHLGLIPDGSRRWALRKGIELLESYRLAMRKLVELLDCAYKSGIGSVSVYLLSKANLRRSSEDLQAVAEAEQELLTCMLPSLAKELLVSIRVAGLEDLAPLRIRSGLRELYKTLGEQADDSSYNRRLYLCIAYDPLDEVALATQNFGSIDLRSLWVPERIDLVVRTGGAITLSDFLPLQCGYARIVFRDELFNDFAAGMLIDIIREHEEQGLKFGE